MPLMLSDVDIAATLRPEDAVSWMREAVTAAASDRLYSPPRVHAALGTGRLVFTVGALRGRWFGYRSYDTFDHEAGDQVVVVHGNQDGRVTAISIGSLLGQLRTGALGGVAVDLLADPRADNLGVVGSGAQAWAQVWAISAVRRLEAVVVHSRTRLHAERFAARVQRELHVECLVADTVHDAIRGRSIVVLATNSSEPVLDPHWLAPGAHVSTVGPKQVGASEFGVELVRRADIVTTDSVSQLTAYDPPTVAAAMPDPPAIHALGDMQTASVSTRREGGVSLYLSVGLAGTEAFMLHELAESIGGRQAAR